MRVCVDWQLCEHTHMQWKFQWKKAEIEREHVLKVCKDAVSEYSKLHNEHKRIISPMVHLRNTVHFEEAPRTLFSRKRSGFI